MREGKAHSTESNPSNHRLGLRERCWDGGCRWLRYTLYGEPHFVSVGFAGRGAEASHVALSSCDAFALLQGGGPAGHIPEGARGGEGVHQLGRISPIHEAAIVRSQLDTPQTSSGDPHLPSQPSLLASSPPYSSFSLLPPSPPHSSFPLPQTFLFLPHSSPPFTYITVPPPLLSSSRLFSISHLHSIPEISLHPPYTSLSAVPAFHTSPSPLSPLPSALSLAYTFTSHSHLLSFHTTQPSDTLFPRVPHSLSHSPFPDEAFSIPPPLPSPPTISLM